MFGVKVVMHSALPLTVESHVREVAPAVKLATSTETAVNRAENNLSSIRKTLKACDFSVGVALGVHAAQFPDRTPAVLLGHGFTAPLEGYGDNAAIFKAIVHDHKTTVIGLARSLVTPILENKINGTDVRSVHGFPFPDSGRMMVMSIFVDWDERAVAVASVLLR